MLVRAITTGAACAIGVAVANLALHSVLEPLAVWLIVTAAYLVGAVDSEWRTVS